MGVTTGVSSGVGVAVGDGVNVGVAVGDAVVVGDAVAVDVGDGVEVGDGVDVGVDVGDGVDVGVRVGEGEASGVAVAVWVAAGVPLPPGGPSCGGPLPPMLFVAMNIERPWTEIVLSTMSTITKTGTAVITLVGLKAVRGFWSPSVGAVSMSPSQSWSSNPCSSSACSPCVRCWVCSPSSGTQSGNCMLITSGVEMSFDTHTHKPADRVHVTDDYWRWTMLDHIRGVRMSAADRRMKLS